MNFCEILKKLRTEKGISQRTLAKDLDVSPTAISHYEKGTKPPTLENVVKLAAYFGVSTDTMLGIETPKEKNHTNLSDCFSIISTLMEDRLLDWDKNKQCFFVKDSGFCRIMDEWSGIFGIMSNGTISRDLYNLWKKDVFEKLSQIPIADNKQGGNI